jgi:tRNA modification GTPase
VSAETTTGKPASELPAGAATATLVTAPARGGIAVIILAGPQAQAILARVFRPRGQAPAPGRLSLGRIVRGEEVLDEAVVALLGDGQATEINIHAGPHVARKVLTLLRECGARIVPAAGQDPTFAVPSRRWENPAVAREMLSALRSAATPLAAAAVTAQWSAGLSQLASSPRPGAKALRAAAGALPLMRRLLTPAEVVITGPPNVGKSALANALVGRNVSIVSDTPGTTRDWVRCLADAEGVGIWLTDTAGLWAAADGIDAEAVRRAWARVESADLVVCLSVGEAPEHAELLRRIRRAANVLNVAGKCDLVEPAGGCDLAVSGRTLAGLDALRRAIRHRLGFADFDPSAAMAFTDRQGRLLSLAAEALDAGHRDVARARLSELLEGPAAASKR